jgi:hypothetical protein
MKKIFFVLTAALSFLVASAQYADDNATIYSFGKDADGDFALIPTGKTVKEYRDAGGRGDGIVLATIEGSDYIMYTGSYEKYAAWSGDDNSGSTETRTGKIKDKGKVLQIDDEFRVGSTWTVGGPRPNATWVHRTIKQRKDGSYKTTQIDFDGSVVWSILDWAHYGNSGGGNIFFASPFIH